MATDIIARGLATSNSGGGGSGTSVDVQAGTGISFSGTDPVIINNNGVTDVQAGTNNGTVKVVIAGKESKSKEVSVKGLSNAAYKDVDTAIDETTKDSENLPTTKAVKESLDKKVDTSKLGDSNGVATLDENKKLKSAQLPSHNHGSNEVNAMTGYSKPSTLADKTIKNTDTLNDAIGKLEKSLDDKMDNGNYAGSSSKGGSATSAEKLTNTEQIGTNTKPVYFSADGVPVAIDYKLEKDVPSTAKLTDTTYSAGTGLRIDSTDNNKIHNMGVLSVNESATNGSIDITIGKNGAETSETKSISIHGLADAAYKDVDKAFGVPTLDANVKISVNQIPTTDNYNVDSAYPVTSKAVKAAIDTLPNPMVFKGSLGVGGTITVLPTAESGNEGFTYKVITNGEYAGQTAKIGDLFISDGSSWIYIPSADEPDGTVTSVGISVPAGLKVKDSTSPITTSGTIEVELDEGYVIPKSADIVPSTRKVNEKVLSADIVLNGADIKADGYTKPKSASAIEATDTVNQAFGKLEYKADLNATNIAKNKTNILTLKKHVTGELTDSDFSEDSTVAMTKTVPSGMSDYAAVKVIGGRTVKRNITNPDNATLHQTSYSNGTWSNALVDTKTEPTPVFYTYKDETRVGNNIINSTPLSDGRRWATFTKDGTFNCGVIGHSGASKDAFVRLDLSGCVDGKTYTCSYRISGNPSTVGGLKITEAMIEEGSTANEYLPFGLINAPVESVVSYPYNLWDEKWEIGGIKDGSPITGTGKIRSKNYIPVEPNTTYAGIWTNGLNIYMYTANKSYIGIIEQAKNSNFTTPSECKYIKFTTFGTSTNSYSNNIAIVRGESGVYRKHNYDETTLLIPDSIKSLPDYGVEGNVVDFENGTYTHTNTITNGAVTALSTAETINISDMLMPIRVEAGGTITFQNEHNLDMPNTIVYKKEVSLI